MDRNSTRYANKSHMGRMLRVLAVAAMAPALSACFVSVPPAVQFASYALDAIVYIETDKTMSDHALSAVTAQDCAMGRVLNGYAICQEDAELTELPIDRDIHTVELKSASQEDLSEYSYQAPYVMGAGGTRHMSLEQILNTKVAPPATLAEVPHSTR